MVLFSVIPLQVKLTKHAPQPSPRPSPPRRILLPDVPASNALARPANILVLDATLISVIIFRINSLFSYVSGGNAGGTTPTAGSRRQLNATRQHAMPIHILVPLEALPDCSSAPPAVRW